MGTWLTNHLVSFRTRFGIYALYLAQMLKDDFFLLTHNRFFYAKKRGREKKEKKP